jgi:O-antigen ligase
MPRPSAASATAPGPEAGPATPPAALLAGSLGLVALGALPLLQGGYSGSGYLVELVLLPLTAALAWLALQRRPALAQAVLLLYLAGLACLPWWVEGGRERWAWGLALPLAWAVTWLLLRQVPERRGLLLPVLVGSAAATGLFGLALWLALGHYDAPLYSTFGLHNPYAGYLLIAWPLAAFGLWTAPTGLARKLYAAALLLLLAVLVLTYSRAAWAVFALQLLGLGVLALGQALRGRFQPRSAADDFALPRWTLAAVPLLLAGLLLLPGVRTVLGRVGDLGGYSMTGRFRFWQAALAIWHDHPLWGVGPGNFEYYYPQYQRDPYFFSNDPHSWPLQLLCELGLPGLVIVLAVLAGTALWLRRIWRGLPVAEAGLLTAALLGSLAHAAVDFDYTYSANTALLGAILAFGTWRAARTAPGSAGNSGSPPPADPAAAGPAPLLEKVLAWASCGLLLICAGWGISFTAERYTLDRLRDTANLPLELRRQLLEQAIRYNPLNHETHYRLAGILAQPSQGSHDAAEHEVQAALALNPRYTPAYVLRGLLTRPPRAGEADLQHALELDPYNYPENYWAYASIAPDDQTKLERLKTGIEKLNVVDPITAHDVRSDWLQWNGMFSKWYLELARLTADQREAGLYRSRGAKFGVAAEQQRQAAEEQAGQTRPPAEKAAPAPPQVEVHKSPS